LNFSEILFVDPTAEEENLATGQLTVVTANNKLCMIHKPGAYTDNAGSNIDRVQNKFHHF
jgi:exosome complex RNA-binding protein Rrp42 (RNase PH superfamily)